MARVGVNKSSKQSVVNFRVNLCKQTPCKGSYSIGLQVNYLVNRLSVYNNPL